MEQDLKAAQDFLNILDEMEENFSFYAKHDQQSGPFLGFYGSLEEHAEELIRLNNAGHGIFILVNKSLSKARKKEDVEVYRAFFADKDDGPFTTFPIEPTMVVQTKNGQHAYWVLKDFENRKDYSRYELQLKSIMLAMDSDPSATDCSRVLRVPGFFHLKAEPFMVKLISTAGEFYSKTSIHTAFPIRGPGRPSQPLKQVDFGSHVRGELFPEFVDFLKIPWGEKGKTGHKLTIDTIKNIKKNNYTEEECIEMLSNKGELNYETINSLKAIYKNNMYQVKPYVPAGRNDIQNKVNNAKLFLDVSVNSQGVWVLSEENSSIEKMNIGVVKRIIGENAYDMKVKPAYTAYRPDFGSALFDGTSGTTLNIYNPPDWKKKNFYSRVPISNSPMPLQYEEFFLTLFGECKESLKYVLDWIAYSLKGSNVCILALVGTNQGVGKEALGNIIAKLHGESNLIKCKQSILKKEFNKSLMGKTFAFMDEVSINDVDEYESIKGYANGIIAMEGKGTEASVERVFLNIYLANNRIDSLVGVNGKNDRRFSVPKITKNTLEEGYFKNNSFGIKDYRDLLEDDLISQLAQHLYHRDLSSYQQNVNLKSLHYHNVVRTSRPIWVQNLLEDFREMHFNHAVPLTKASTIIMPRATHGLGETSILPICEEFPNILALKRIGLVKHLVFAKENEALVDFKLRVQNLSRTDNAGFIVVDKPIVRIDR